MTIRALPKIPPVAKRAVQSTPLRPPLSRSKAVNGFCLSSALHLKNTCVGIGSSPRIMGSAMPQTPIGRALRWHDRVTQMSQSVSRRPIAKGLVSIGAPASVGTTSVSGQINSYKVFDTPTEVRNVKKKIDRFENKGASSLF